MLSLTDFIKRVDNYNNFDKSMNNSIGNICDYTETPIYNFSQDYLDLVIQATIGENYVKHDEDRKETDLIIEFLFYKQQPISWQVGDKNVVFKNIKDIYYFLSEYKFPN
jgi:hypothetical protein